MRDVDAKLHVVSGSKVRSLLERRWIIFFNYLGVDVEYEPERFKDGVSNIGYLPDMLIHEKLYLEIKPTIEILRDEIKKPYGFVRNTGKRLLIVVGNPPGDMVLAIFKRENNSVGYKYVRDVSWHSLSKRNDIDIHKEKSAAMSAMNNIDSSLSTPIARCLDSLKKEKLEAACLRQNLVNKGAI